MGLIDKSPTAVESILEKEKLWNRAGLLSQQTISCDSFSMGHRHLLEDDVKFLSCGGLLLALRSNPSMQTRRVHFRNMASSGNRGGCFISCIG
jgi:hypothetical protein